MTDSAPDGQMSIRAVLFDMDGTITRPYLNFRLIRETLGVPEGASIMDHIESLRGHAREEARDSLHRWEAEAAEAAELNDGVLEVFRFLADRGILRGLLTRNSLKSVETTLARLGLSFDAVVTREEPPLKPHPDSVFRLAGKLSVSAAECLVVGDYLYDVDVGRAAGARTVLLTNRIEPQFESEEDYRIDHLEELIGIIKTLNNSSYDSNSRSALSGSCSTGRNAMKKFVRKNIRQMDGYVPGAQPACFEGIIKLNTNENAYPPSPKVIEAIRDWMVNGRSLRYYPDPTSMQLREIAADLYQVKPEEVIIGNGSDELLRLAFTLCTEPGRGVAFPVPTYSLYPVLARIQDAPVEEIFFEDPDSLPGALYKSDARLVIVANPNPPYGTVFPLDPIERLCQSDERCVVLDEAYADFCDVTAIPLIKDYANLFVTRTLSKSLSLAGDRIGLGFAQAALIRELDKVRDSYNVSTLAQVAAIAALQDQDYFLETRNRICATRDRFRQALIERGARVPESGGNFVFVRWPGRDGAKIHKELERKGIFIRYFDDPILKGGVRISIGTDEQMDRVLQELDEIIKSG